MLDYKINQQKTRNRTQKTTHSDCKEEFHQKIRADILLVNQTLAPTRTKAQSLIMSGQVYQGTQKIAKPSDLVYANLSLTIKQKDHPYVSRGGVKLEAALKYFKIDVKNKICLDVGASTGGFTDCLLQNGAKKIYAVDVGYGQLAYPLRKDDRVIIFERTNFRHFDVSLIKESVDIVTMDVSFISVMKLIPKIMEICCRGGVFPPGRENLAPTIIILIKPQFEVGKEHVGKGGIVKDKEKQKECVKKIEDFCKKEGFQIIETIPSPILGQMGNQEYLSCLCTFKNSPKI